jgi:hypothetical protein
MNMENGMSHETVPIYRTIINILHSINTPTGGNWISLKTTQTLKLKASLK